MRTLSIALLAALLSTSAASAQSAARNLLPMGGDMGYGSTGTREPVTTGSTIRRAPVTAEPRLERDGLWLSTGARPQVRGVPGRIGF